MEIIDLVSSESESEYLQSKFNNLTRRQSLSLFDVNASNAKKKETEYEEKLNNELSEWIKFIKNAKSHTSTIDPKVTVIDQTCLSPDKIKYLEAKPNLQKFVDDTMKFQIKAHNFLHEYKETEEMKNNLVNLCVEKLDRIKENIFEKYIYE